MGGGLFGASNLQAASSGGGSGSNASVGTTGSTAPTSATEIAGVTSGGLLKAFTVDSSGNSTANIGNTALISTANSSVTTLSGGASFTGTSEDVSQYAEVRVSVFADQVSATDGLAMQQSKDGTNWDFLDNYTIPASSGKVYGVGVAAQFFRVVYTNGATIQGAFRLVTVYHKTRTKPSSQRAGDAYSNENDAEVSIGLGMAYNGATWDRIRGDTTNGLFVQVKSSALPTGSATAALQTTGNTSVASIDTKTPALGQALAAASVPVVLTAAQISTLTPLSTVTANQGTANTATNGWFTKITDGVSTAAVKAASTAAVAADPAQVVALSPNNNTLANALFVKNTDGTNTGAVKAASTAAGATDPALVVALSPNNNTLANALFVKNSDGTNTAAVKAASTAPLATDPALVVSLSPNSTTPKSSGRALANAPTVTTYGTPVTSAAYVTIIASTTSATNLVEIFDSSGVAIFFATGAAASEVNQFVIYPGGNGQVPLSIPAGTRISYKAVSTSATGASAFNVLNLYT